MARILFLPLSFLLLLFPLLSLPLPAIALEVPDKAPPNAFVVIKHEPDSYIRIRPAPLDGQLVSPAPDTILLVGTPGTKYTILEVYQKEGKWVDTEVTLTITDKAPPPSPNPDPSPPDPPNPPDPDPLPPNPEPDPVPDPPPPSLDGPLKVLILYETRDPNGPVISSARTGEIHRYLSSHAITADRKPLWRLWDDDYTDQDLSFTTPEWRTQYKKAIQESQGQRPWIMATNGERGASVRLPATVPATLDLLKRYGGNGN